MSDSPELSISRIGQGGRIYRDAREQQQTKTDPPSWADQPEPLPQPKPKPAPEPPKSVVSVKTPPPDPTDWREIISTTVELVGVTSLSVGFFLIHIWCGLIIAGICLVALGVLTSRKFDS